MATPDETGSVARRRRPWLVVALILALVAAGAAGAVAGRVTAPVSGASAAPTATREEPPDVDVLPQGNATAAPQETVGTGAPSLQLSTSVRPADDVVLTPSDDVPDIPTTASGYRVSRAGISSGQVAGVLGSAFGVAGSPTQVNGGWRVGSPNGTGPAVEVSDDPMVSWSFVDPTPTATPTTAPTPAATPATSPTATATQTMELDRALLLAEAFLGSVGVDVSSVDWQVDRYRDSIDVTGWQLVAGSRTSLGWRVSFTPDGAVASASGFSAGLEEVPGYPVVGAATAVRRSMAPGWSSIGPAPVPLPAGVDVEPDASASPSPRRPAAAGSRRCAWRSRTSRSPAPTSASPSTGSPMAS